MTPRSILHADMDAFFAAVEARENPTIADQPVVVGADPQEGRGRGVVAACNYAARKYGIASAMPISQAYRRCPHAVYLRPRGHLYAEVSERILHILESFTDLVEKISIDEAFLDVSASVRLFGDGAVIARRIKTEVWQREKLTVSIGVATNKFIAKLASDLEKPDGLVVVPPGKEKDFLRPLPVERLWGVGAKTAVRLRALGFQTIGDIAHADPGLLKRQFGDHHATHLQRLAHGDDDRPVEPGHEFKQISRETTFLSDTHDREFVRRTLLSLTEEVSARLRRRGLVARTVTLKLRLAPFETLTRRVTTDDALFTTDAIYPLALNLLQAADPEGRPIRLIGVGVSGLHEREPEQQLTLFERADERSSAARISQVVDEISEKFGRGRIRRGKLLEDSDD